VYHWNADLESHRHHYGNFIIFSIAALSAFLIFLILHPDIARITRESPILIDIMYVPIFAIGVIYGMKIVERVIKPSEPRGRIKGP
jgi:hypothetical protein